MKFLVCIFLVISYVLAFIKNLMPALKHPDLTMDSIHVLSTLFFLAMFVLFVIKVHERFKYVLLVGMLSGLIVFVVNLFEELIFKYAILDVIASIQYPLYIIFITPFFGANMLLDIGYGSYSLLISFVYFLIYMLKVVTRPRINK